MLLHIIVTDGIYNERLSDTEHYAEFNMNMLLAVFSVVCIPAISHSTQSFSYFSHEPGLLINWGMQPNHGYVEELVVTDQRF